MKGSIINNAIVLCVLFTLVSCSTTKTFDPSVDYRSLARAGIGLGMDIEEDDDWELMVEAASWLGVRYKYGGNTKNGVDCSGLTCNIYRNVYDVELHRRSVDQYKKDVKKTSRKKLRCGDLVFFATGKDKIVSHVGVYLKNNKFLHASSQRGVVVSDLNQKYYKERFISGGKVK